MSEDRAGAKKVSVPDAKRQADFATRLLRSFGSVKFALVILSVLAVVCIVGTLLPQESEVTEYLAKHPDAKARMDFLGILGLTHLFRALWFRILLCLLAVSLSLCTWRRVRSTLRKSGRMPSRLVGSMVTHASILLILVGAVIRSGWGQHGELPLLEGTFSDVFYTANTTNPLPFTVELVDFEIEFYEEDILWVRWRSPERVQRQVVVQGKEYKIEPPPDAENVSSYRVSAIRFVPDFVLDGSEVRSRSSLPNNPALQVVVQGKGNSVTNWLFARHPQFNMHGEGAADLPFDLLYQSTRGGAGLDENAAIKDWKSHLRVRENGVVVKEKTIEVNDPLRYGGYTFFQSGYRGTRITILKVARDPGVPVVYAGFCLMIVGLFISFCTVPAGDVAGRRTVAKEEQDDA